MSVDVFPLRIQTLADISFFERLSYENVFSVLVKREKWDRGHFPRIRWIAIAEQVFQLPKKKKPGGEVEPSQYTGHDMQDWGEFRQKSREDWDFSKLRRGELFFRDVLNSIQVTFRNFFAFSTHFLSSNRCRKSQKLKTECSPSENQQKMHKGHLNSRYKHSFLEFFRVYDHFHTFPPSDVIRPKRKQLRKKSEHFRLVIFSYGTPNGQEKLDFNKA